MIGMKLSRRDFVHAGCAIGAVTLVPSIVDKAEAWTHGLAAPTTNLTRVSINVPATGTGIMNLAKGWQATSPSSLTASQIDSNGYPVGTLSASKSGSLGVVSSYYGEYVWSWSGQGTMQLSPPAIVYSGGSFVSGISPSASGSVGANLSVSGTSPTVIFKFGALVASVSGGNGSLVTVTTSIAINFTSGFLTGSKLQFGVGCSSNLINGPNSDGSWTITNVSNTQFTLNGSTGVISPTITASGGPGVQTEVIQNIGSTSLFYLNGTFSSFTNLVICQQGDVTDIASGKIWRQDLVNQLLALKGTPLGVGRSGDFWLRFMDVSGVQGNFEADFSQRLIPAAQCWTNPFPIAAYQAGTITNGGASGSFTDLYSCASNPTNSPSSGPPIDCEIIQGTASATNSGGLPGLTVSGRTGFGNWPIIDNIIEPIILNATAPASSGLTLQFSFSATWLNSGSPYTFSYTTVSGDTTLSTFQANLEIALAADTTLKTGKIVFSRNGLAGYVYISPPTALAGALTVTYTSGPAIMTICSLLPSSIGSSGVQTFVFNALLGAFINVSTFVRSYPCEALVELCNRVGANLWYNWPIYTKGALVTALTNFMTPNSGTGLNSGLKFGTETGNENWNTGAQLWNRCQTYGIALGLFQFPYGNDYAPYSWQGLRTIQYAALSRAAWASGGGVSGNHYIMNMSAEFDTAVGSNFDTNCLKGQFLVTTNLNFANYGGLGGTTVSTSYNAAPNRPVDISNAIGCAPYWASHWMGGTASANPTPLKGTVTQNADMLQASFNFASALTSTAFTSLANEFNGTTIKSGGSTGGIDFVSYATVFTNEEAQAAQFDNSVSSGVRYNSLPNLAIIHYEGGPQWTPAANLNNGVNTADSTATTITADTTDLNALVTAMTNLGWTTTQLTPYTISGTGNLTEVATNILQMSQGWKYDTDLNGNAANTGSYKGLIKTSYYQQFINTSGPNREVHPCQYGYQATTWGFWYNTYDAAGSPYQNYNAIEEFNA